MKKILTVLGWATMFLGLEVAGMYFLAYALLTATTIN